MTDDELDALVKRLRDAARDAETDTSQALWDYPEMLRSAADAIDALRSPPADVGEGVTLNLSGWMDRRRENLTQYADHILHSVRAYEAEIAALRALAETTKGDDPSTET